MKKEYPAAVREPEDPMTVLQRQMAEVLERLEKISQWKDRQEAKQTERLVMIYNDVIEVFARHGATITEVSTVLDMVRNESLSAIKRASSPLETAVLSSEPPNPIS
ncbi:MAG TPA: hypothetical protein PK659_10035 [Methanothrix sp.]|mgnify:CR=1 FL=1|nr:hypothetical protein [Methanothrix sp.]HOL44580.1 hypothetical protein [Methanothrix sp.]